LSGSGRDEYRAERCQSWSGPIQETDRHARSGEAWNSRDNIEDNEMKALKRLTRYYLTLKPGEIKTALQCGELNEVNCDEKGT